MKAASFSAVSLILFSVRPRSGFIVISTWCVFLITYFKSRFSKYPLSRLFLSSLISSMYLRACMGSLSYSQRSIALTPYRSPFGFPWKSFSRRMNSVRLSAASSIFLSIPSRARFLKTRSTVEINFSLLSISEPVTSIVHTGCL